MSSNFAIGTQVLNWNRRILDLFGVWPENPKNIRFSLFIIYLILWLASAYQHLHKNIKDLESIVNSMTDNIPFVLLLFNMLLFRLDMDNAYNVIRQIRENIAKSDDKSDQEIVVYRKYITKARSLVRFGVFLILLPAIILFTKPLIAELISLRGNNTLAFVLPYRARPFFDIVDVPTYAICYILELPLPIIAVFGTTGIDCLLITLTYHVCSELSVLTFRITNLNCKDKAYDEIIRNIIYEHFQLIRIAHEIDNVFNPLFMTQLFGGIFLICFLGHHVLSNIGDGLGLELINFISYICATTTLVFLHCYIGECLTNESSNILDAFYNSSWYEMPAEDAKWVVMGMIQSQKPLHLTAGKLYVFSLATFTDIIKSSAGYMSVLRTLL